MSNRIPVAFADVELQVATAIAVGATSFTLASATDDDGVALPAGVYCFTIDSGTSNKEYLLGQLNGVNVTTVVSVSRQGAETTGAARAHRVGAPCIVTNFATLQRVADILRGVLPIDADTPLAYDAEPTLADREQLATVGYVLDAAFGGAITFDSQVITGNAGEAIVAGNLVYFKTSDQEWYKTDADTAATIEGVQLGIALGTGSDGVAITGGIQISGTYTTTGLTAGSLYYAGNTAGAISTSAGTNIKIIGTAVSTTKLLIYPQTLSNTFLNATTGMISMYASATPPAGFLLCNGQAVSRTGYAALFSVTGTAYGAGDGSTTFNVPDLASRFPLGYSASAPTKAFTFTSRSGNLITVTGADNHAHNELQTGQAIVYTSSGTVITGLTSGNTYYIIRNAYNQFSLASSVANANAGTVIALSSDGTGAQTFTITYTARPMGQAGGEEIHALTDAEMPSHVHPTSVGTGSLDGTQADGASDTISSQYPTGSAGSDTPHNNMPLFTVVNYIIKT